MKPPLAHEDLDRAATQGCQHPGCKCGGTADPLYLKANCHPDADVMVSYAFASGILAVQCAVCGKLVANIAVASRAGN